MVSKFANKTVEELKEMCRQKNIRGYSKLKKEDLIKLVKKNSIMKNVKVKKSKKGGVNLIRTDPDKRVNANREKMLDKMRKVGLNVYKKYLVWNTSNGNKSTNNNQTNVISQETLNASQYPWVKLTKTEYTTLGQIKRWMQICKNSKKNITNPLTRQKLDSDFLRAIDSLPDNNEEALNLLKLFRIRTKLFRIRTDDDIHKAVNDWCSNPNKAVNMYGPIHDWDTSQVTKMNHLFSGKNRFNNDISRWDVSDVENMESMFHGASSFNGNINSWNTSKVINMAAMFDYATSFNQPIGWDVSNVENMENMFYDASVFNQDISGWDTSNVTNINEMFKECPINDNYKPQFSVTNNTNIQRQRTKERQAQENAQEKAYWDAQTENSMKNLFRDRSINKYDFEKWFIEKNYKNGEINKKKYDYLLKKLNNNSNNNSNNN
jgi:surface protein